MEIIVKGIDTFSGKKFSYIKKNVAQVTYINQKIVIIYDDATTGSYDSNCADDLMVTIVKGGE